MINEADIKHKASFGDGTYKWTSDGMVWYVFQEVACTMGHFGDIGACHYYLIDEEQYNEGCLRKDARYITTLDYPNFYTPENHIVPLLKQGKVTDRTAVEFLRSWEMV